MSFLQFFASLASSLAWPIAALVIALVFRTPIMKMLDQLAQRMRTLTKVKAGGFEAKFAEKAAALRSTAMREHEAAPRPSREYAAEFFNQVQRQLVETARSTLSFDPRSSVLQAGGALEAALTSAAADLQLAAAIENSDGDSVPATITALRRAGVVSSTDAEQLAELWNLQNLAAHDSRDEISVSSASQYIDLTARVLTVLNRGVERYKAGRVKRG